MKNPSVALKAAVIGAILAASLSPCRLTAAPSQAITTGGIGSADLSVTKVDTPDPVIAGTNLTYTITVSNAGPSSASTAVLGDMLPALTTFVSLSSSAGWSCTTPPVGFGGSVSCSNPSFAVDNAVFTLVVKAGSFGTRFVISNTATISAATGDSNTGNNSATATTTAVPSADLSVTKVDLQDPVTAGQILFYTITVTNAGPSQASSAVLSDTVPPGTTIAATPSPDGWTCFSSSSSFFCTTNTPIPVGETAEFLVVVDVDPSVTAGTVLSNTATVSSPAADPSPGNNSATETTTVLVRPGVSATKTVGGELFSGGTLTYTVKLTNAGPAAQADNPGPEMTDVLPAQLTLLSASASSGTPMATIGTNTVTWNGSIPVQGSVTITIQARINDGLATGTTITNQAVSSYDSDGNGTNESNRLSDDPAVPGAISPTAFAVAPRGMTEIPTLDGVGSALLFALLALGGAALLRRRNLVP